MLEVEKIEQWRGEEVVDRDGEKIGKLDDVYTEVGSGDPGVAAISAGFLGRKTLLVPLQGASLSRDFLRLAISKDQMDGAPEAGDDGQLDRSREVALFGHYDLDPPADSDSDSSRYESKAVREENSERAAELRAEAAELKGEAKDRDAEASEARDQRSAAESERDKKAEKADELRREADRLEN